MVAFKLARSVRQSCVRSPTLSLATNCPEGFGIALPHDPPRTYSSFTPPVTPKIGL
ncbi:MAG: hypothetical protein WA631_11660 [Nitrososphaeraceae archaeon]